MKRKPKVPDMLSSILDNNVGNIEFSNDGNTSHKENPKDKKIPYSFKTSKETKYNLEDLWIDFYKMDREIQKSAIIETALEIAIDEYRRLGNKSEIYNRIFSQKKI